MPVLCEEVSLYPETLLADDMLLEARDGDGVENPEDADESEDAEDSEDSKRQWWVLYTKPRQEKSLARELFRQQIPFYLPLVEKTRLYRGWRVTSRVPVFGGYLFLLGTEQERGASFATNRIAATLPVYEPERLLRELRQVERLLAAKVPMTVESRLVVGNRVRVRTGPLAGLEGTILKRRGKTRLVVHVTQLMQGASVEIDDFMLEPLG